MKVKSLALGFLTGGAAAAIAALLTAPSSGKETRRKLAENTKVFASELKDLNISLMQIKDSIASASKEGKVTISEFLHDIKLAVHDWKVEIEHNKSEISTELKEIEQTIADLEKSLANHDK